MQKSSHGIPCWCKRKTTERYVCRIRGAQQQNQPVPNSMVPINEAPVLPAANGSALPLGQSALKMPPPLGISNPADEKAPAPVVTAPVARPQETPTTNTNSGAVWR